MENYLKKKGEKRDTSVCFYMYIWVCYGCQINYPDKWKTFHQLMPSYYYIYGEMGNGKNSLYNDNKTAKWKIQT